jgi:glycerophosphoryl diester phosphodiesterase
MKIIGHRGAAAIAPENTLESIQESFDAGAEIIEIDIRTTLDGHAVVIHDELLPRQGLPPLVVAHVTLDELQKSAPDLPTLDAVFRAFPHIRLMLDIRPGTDIGPVLDSIKEALANGRAAESLWVGSKSFKLLQAVKQAQPAIDLVVTEPWSGVRASYRARKLGTRRLAMNRLWLWPGFIRAVSRHYELYAYTLDDATKAARWEKAGLAGVFTDDPRLYIRKPTTKAGQDGGANTGSKHKYIPGG